MAMGSYTDDDDSSLMSEINMTPLVDVMLVLLIIFIVTLPVINQAVKIELPQANSQPENTKPAKIDLSIKADGSVLWNNVPIDDATLQTRIAEAARAKPQPELHLFADKAVRYEKVAQVLSDAQAAGLTKLGFVTEPKKK